MIIGWREWASLPQLNIPLIKVKMDTGAKSSVIHVDNIKLSEVEGEEYAEFLINPIQGNKIIYHQTRVKTAGRKIVKSSNGQKEERILICSKIRIGESSWDIDITLTNRDDMNHRMLLGRDAMKNILVNPAKSYLQGLKLNSEVIETYQLTESV